MRMQPPARRPPRRVRIYPRYQAGPGEVDPWYFPGENAVRECNATYVQEYRPSGTVIVPRMSCLPGRSEPGALSSGSIR